MRNLILSTLFIFTGFYIFGQCTLNTITNDETITCGDCVNLSAFGSGTGNVAFEEDFNSGSPQGWGFTQAVTIANNTCGVPSPDGSDFMWMGDASVNPRDMTTVSLDLTLGGIICFEMRYAVQQGASPCEGPDEPQEGVYLQYSIDNGNTWITIEYWDPNGGYDNYLTSWNQYCVTLPAGALTVNTKIRWHQDNVSGAEFDHWGIDNVSITLNDPTYEITWLHDSYSYGFGSGGGENPTPVCPTTTTTYTAQISNGTNTCTSAITINVVDPIFIIDVGNDTTICNGECLTLNATAYEQVSPASTPTFSNNQTSIVTGGNANMNINVQGLNMTSLTNGSITSICLNSFNFSGTQVCTSFSGCNCNGTNIALGSTCNLDISSFNITVTSPCGVEITLVPQYVASGTSYSNVCFVPSGGQSITGGGFPTAGNWQSSEPFSDLNGCDPNGVWNMDLNAPGGLGIGVGSLQGWSISFDDPEITSPVNFTWSPTTNMTNETTLSPTICPAQNTTSTYTLTVTDTDNCATANDEIQIITSACCPLQITDLQSTPSSCVASDGTITTTITGSVGTVLYSLDNFATTPQTTGVFNNLSAGTYTVYVNDDNNCIDSLTVVVASSNAPTITNAALTHPSCSNDDGSIIITATGGTGTLNYSINNGTPQTTSTFSSLASGIYAIEVEDANGCTVSQSVTLILPTGPTITNITPTAPTCGANDGSISITATGGTAPIEYSIDGGTSFSTNATFNNLGANSYVVVISDDNGCTATQNVNLSNTSGPSITSTTNVDPSCGGSNGSITINATGGSAPLSYSIDNGTTSQANALFNNLSANTYNIVVEDANGCTAIETVTLTAGSGPTITSVTPTAANCGGADGALTVIATGGTSPLSYSIDNGTTSQPNGTFSSLSAGTYPVLVEDANGCQVTGSGTITTTANPTINAGVDQTICEGDVVTLTGSGGVSYVWDNGVTNATAFTPTTSGTYTVTGTDANGCSNTDQVTITVVPNPTASFTADPMTGYSPLVVTFTNTSSNASGYVWTFGNGTTPVTTTSDDDQTSSYINQGVYTVTLVATNGNCTDSFSLPITVDSLPPAIVHIPNVFTPNNDGSNDAFYIDVLHGKTIHVLIFNRWGNQMFEINDFKTKWDGADASEGVYFFTYEIEGVSGEILKGHGHVSLLRK